jgi:hypothetical protein
MGEIYDVRSSVEHLHEDRYLDPLLRAMQVDLTKKEAIIEHIARTTLARIALDETLWQHFTNKAALAGLLGEAGGRAAGDLGTAARSHGSAGRI